MFAASERNCGRETQDAEHGHEDTNAQPKPLGDPAAAGEGNQLPQADEQKDTSRPVALPHRPRDLPPRPLRVYKLEAAHGDQVPSAVPRKRASSVGPFP
jgi:hypothetical protein